MKKTDFLFSTVAGKSFSSGILTLSGKSVNDRVDIVKSICLSFRFCQFISNQTYQFQLK